MNEQADRIERNVSGETPPTPFVRLDFASRTTPEDVLERSRQVMRLVSVAQREDWPADQEWLRRLPAWFLDSFSGHTLDQLLANPTLWDFGSWLDAMKDPGWEWWSSEVHAQTGVVRCVAYSDPFAVEPLVYLLRAAGAQDVHFTEE